MEDAPIVAGNVVTCGQKDCKEEKGDIVNKGTATNLQIVKVRGIVPNVTGVNTVPATTYQLTVIIKHGILHHVSKS